MTRISLTAAFLALSAFALQAQIVPAHDANSAMNTGRKQLSDYLDQIAAHDTAARGAAVDAVTTRAQAEAPQVMVRKRYLR